MAKTRKSKVGTVNNMKKGDEYLTPEQRGWDAKRTKAEIEKVQNDGSLDNEYKAMKLKELRLVLKIKHLQDRMELEDKIRDTLGIKLVAGKFYPPEVAKVIGTTERQAVVIEKKALAKLKSPKLGRQLRKAQYE